MTTLDPILLVALGLAVAIVLFVVARKVLRIARVPDGGKRRVVEKPNSHYTSQAVHETQTRHRWREIELDGLHEVNREEVVRLLARVEATRMEALSPREREFLNYMAEISPRASGGGRSLPPK